MMLVDVASGCAVASTAEALSDGYAASNITSPGCTAGFVAAHFIKAPVTLTIHLGTRCTVARIVICPRQHSTHRPAVITVSGCHTPGSDRADRWVTFGDIAPREACLCVDFPRFSQSHAPVQLWQDVALPPEAVRARVVEVHRPIRAVSAIKLCIQRTIGSSIPSIGRVFVFGEPVEAGSPAKAPRLVSAPPTKTLFGGGSILGGDTDNDDTDDNDASVAGVAPDDGLSNRKRAAATDTVEAAFDVDAPPSRFVDPLTDELMTTPVILPSGNRIDASSLARHLSTSMTDPFTGVTLTDADSILDLNLKEEIDTYRAAHHHPTPAATQKRPRPAHELGFSAVGYRLGAAPKKS